MLPRTLKSASFSAGANHVWPNGPGNQTNTWWWEEYAAIRWGLTDRLEWNVPFALRYALLDDSPARLRPAPLSLAVDGGVANLRVVLPDRDAAYPGDLLASPHLDLIAAKHLTARWLLRERGLVNGCGDQSEVDRPQLRRVAALSRRAIVRLVIVARGAPSDRRSRRDRRPGLCLPGSGLPKRALRLGAARLRRLDLGVAAAVAGADDRARAERGCPRPTGLAHAPARLRPPRARVGDLARRLGGRDALLVTAAAQRRRRRARRARRPRSEPASERPVAPPPATPHWQPPPAR